MRKMNIFAGIAALAASLVLVACGGGNHAGAAASGASTTIQGNAVAGPVNGATVTFKTPSGTVLGTTTTAANNTGSYSFTTSHVGDVVIEVSGGSYIDEATGNTVNLTTPLRSVINANGGTVTGMVTEFTSIAYAFNTNNGSTAATSAGFNTAIGNLSTQFGINQNLLSTLPVVTGSTNAYGNALRALSQYLDNEQINFNNLLDGLLESESFTSFNTAYATAFQTINGSSVTVSFDGSTITVNGSGIGGGSGVCGVRVTGNVSNGGISVPIAVNYCLQGLPTTCDSTNSSVTESLSSAITGAGIVNAQVNTSNTCAAGAITINYAS